MLAASTRILARRAAAGRAAPAAAALSALAQPSTEAEEELDSRQLAVRAQRSTGRPLYLDMQVREMRVVRGGGGHGETRGQE